MLEHQNELAMAVLVASTAFAGLTGVVIGQITQHKLPISTTKRLKNSLQWSFMAGVIAASLAIFWFVKPCIWTVGVAAIGLVFQISLFWPIVYRFWSIEE